jgi:hypothetical protein
MEPKNQPIEPTTSVEEESKRSWKAPTIEELPYTEAESNFVNFGGSDFGIYTGVTPP